MVNRKQKAEEGKCYDCSLPAKWGRKRCKKHLSSNRNGVKTYFKSDKGQKAYWARKNAGDYRKKERAWAHKHRRTLKGRFARAKQGALKRGLSWNISLKLFGELIVQPCAYCGLNNNVETSAGLDRISNKKGYSKTNVLPCCWTCNIVKSGQFSAEEMQILGPAIREVRLKRIQDGTDAPRMAY